MQTTVQTFPEQIAHIENEQDVVFIALVASRYNDDGERVPLTPSQKECARNAAQAALELTPGTEVLGNSTALLLPNVRLQDGESLTLKINASVVKTTPDNPDSGSEGD